jgi:hypothetical protein
VQKKRKPNEKVVFGNESSERNSKSRRPRMNSEPLNLTLSRSNIVDQVAALLYATGAVHDNEEITNIQFSDLFGVSATEFTSIKVFTKERTH